MMRVMIRLKNVLFSEIRRLLQIMAILAAGNPEQTQIESECLISNLHMLSCKRGCMNCNGNELVHRLVGLHGQKHYLHGQLI